MTTRQIPSEEQVLEWMDTLSNWGRWGDDDQLGTVNLITDTKRAQAAALVREGISVTCSRAHRAGGRVRRHLHPAAPLYVAGW